MNKAFLEKRLSEVIRIDATITNRGDFLATHVPFDSLKYIPSGNAEQPPIILSEEEFLQKVILERRDKHSFILVEGENGSGKSHFIRWLKEKYEQVVDSKTDEVLLVNRSQSTLKGALEQIINSDFFRESLELENFTKMVKASDSLSGESLKQSLALEFARASDEVNDENCSLKRSKKKMVYDFFVDRTVQKLLSQPKGPIDRICSRLVSDESNDRKDEINPRFLADDFKFRFEDLTTIQQNNGSRGAVNLAEDLASVDQEQLREQLAEYLNSLIEVVVQRCTKLGGTDLKELFDRVRIELKKLGKNLTLFIEDITSFTGIDRALVEVLRTEHEGDGYTQFCRLTSVVGITEAYYRETFRENLKDRITGMVFLNDVLLKEDDQNLIEMAARYLNAIHLKSEIISNWVELGSYENDLPIAEDNLKFTWSLFELRDGRKLSIFPFNERALKRMFNSLTIKTPREFLRSVIMHVFKIYLDTHPVFPPGAKDFEGGLIKTPLWEKHQRLSIQHIKDFERLESLILWWGNGTVDIEKSDGQYKIGSLSIDVFNAFGFSNFPSIFLQNSKDELIERDRTVSEVIENEKMLVLPDKQELSVVIDKKIENKDKSNEQLKTKEELKFKEVQRSLYDWSQGGKFKLLNEFRGVVKDILTDYIDWEIEGISAYLVNAKLTANSIIFEDQWMESKREIIVEVRRSELTYYALTALAGWYYWGKKSWHFPESSDYLISLHQWLLDIKDEVVEAIKKPKNIDGDWSLFKWSLINQFYFNVFSGNLSLKDESTEVLYQKLFSCKPQLIRTVGHSQYWDERIQSLSKNQVEINYNYDFFIRYHNCVQGKVSGAVSTDVFFLDAHLILQDIQFFKDIEWDIEKIDLPKVDIQRGIPNPWYCSLDLLKDMKNYVEKVLVEEYLYAQKIILNFEQYLGTSPQVSEVETLFMGIRLFLNKLAIVNEDYISSQFVFANKDVQELIMLREELVNMISENRYRQYLYFSSGKIALLEEYLNFLKNTEELIERIQRKYVQKKENYSQDISGIEGIVKEGIDIFGKYSQVFEELKTKSEGDLRVG